MNLIQKLDGTVWGADARTVGTETMYLIYNAAE